MLEPIETSEFSAGLAVTDGQPPQPPPPLPDTVGPVIRGVRLVKSKRGVTKIVLTLSEPLSPTAAASLANFILQQPGHGKKKIALKWAQYDAAAGTITLKPRRVIPRGTAFRLTVVAAGLTDAAGNPLDGNGDGMPGDNFRRLIRVPV